MACDHISIYIYSVRAPIFSDATSDWKLDALPVSDRKEAIRRGGYALAAVDYNDDQRSDLLVGHYGSIQLLQNTGTAFVDVTEKEGLQYRKTLSQRRRHQSQNAQMILLGLIKPAFQQRKIDICKVFEIE